MYDRAGAATFLQGLRGLQPLIIVMFMSVNCAAQTIEQMCELTGESDEKLRKALGPMIAKGWVVQQTGAHGKRSYMPGSSSFFGLLEQSLFLPSQNPVFPDSGAVVNDVAIGLNNSLPLQQHQQQLTPQNPQNPDSADLNVSADEKAILAALLQVGRRGIAGKKARMLAKLPWVTVDYVKAHAAQLKRETWDNPEGMAIYRMEERMTPDALLETDSEQNTVYHEIFVDKGKRGQEVVKFSFDVLQEIADFTGHKKGCRCMDCSMVTASGGDLRILCADCKHYHCICEVEDGE